MFTCILCKSLNFQIENHTIRNNFEDMYKILKCVSCSHIQLFPNDYDTNEYYNNDTQVKEILTISDRSKLHYSEMLKFESLKRLNILQKHIILKDNLNVIDIGGGTGEFITLLNNTKYNLKLSILEPGVIRLNECILENVNRINQSLDDEFIQNNEGLFDIVTAFHVLEHTIDPIQFVNNCYKLLKQNGLLYIEVPNQDNDLIKISDYYKNNIWYCKSHISYFTKNTLKYIFNKLNINNYVIGSQERYDYENYTHWVTHNKPQKIPTYYKEYVMGMTPDETSWLMNRDLNITSEAIYAIIRK